MFKLLVGKIWGACGLALTMISLFLWSRNKTINKRNEDLNYKTKDQAKTIATQKKIIHVIKNTKPVDLDGNIKRMRDGKSSREFLYKNSLSHHRTSVVAYGGFILIFRKLLLKREQANSFEPN
jgi:hypothetical protein